MIKNISLELANDEALVLFDWLRRFNDKENLNAALDAAEIRVLFDLESQLESLLIEPFDSNYKEIVEKARSSLRADWK